MEVAVSTAVRGAAVRGKRRRRGDATRLLTLCCTATPVLDVITNVTIYLERQDFIVAVLKGLILLIVIGHLRRAFSVLTVFSFVSIFLLRESLVGIGGVQIEWLPDLTVFLRILTFIAWLLLFHERRKDAAFLERVLRIFVVTAGLSAIAGFAGLALSIDFFKAYGEDRNGYKGIFSGENDTSIFYVVALVYGMTQVRRERYWFAALIASAMVLLGLGSKTALLGVVLTPALFVFFSPAKHFAALVRRALIYFFLPLGLIVLAIELDSILDAIGYESLTRVISQSDLLSAALSFRDLKAASMIESIHSPIDLLFGMHIDQPWGIGGIESSGQYMVEIDIFDYLFRVGIIGTLLTVMAVWTTSAASRWRTATPEFKTFASVILLTGLTAGHVLVSAMNAVWIAFFFVYYSLGYRRVALPRTKRRRRALSALSSSAMPVQHL